MYSINNDKPANEVLYTLSYVYNWICDKCNGEFSATIEEVNDGYCPYCENKRVLTGKNDFKTMYPHLVDLYSNDNALPPSRILYTSGFYYKWHCDVCDGDFKTSIDRLDKEGCPYCNDIKVLTGKNDLKTILPDIADRYSSSNEKSASEILYNSKSTYNWNCFDCGGEYRATIDDIKNGYCPYCEDKKVLTGKNDLKTMYPELAKLYSLNNNKPVEKVLYLSKGSFNWICSICHGEFNASIEDTNNKGCPYCDNRKVLAGLNDITTIYPNIANLYSSNNERTASEVLYTNVRPYMEL